METKKLSNGVQIPVLGFGVYQIWDEATCVQSVREAIDTGYRLFDTAFVYGNEAAVGKAVKESGVDREQFFLQSKVWTKDMGYEKTAAAIDEALRKMQTDYLDLFLIHEPMGDYYGSWRAMEEAYTKGKLRAIGVCNMWPDRLLDLILNVDIVPHLTQIETHPFQQQWTIAPLLHEYAVTHEAWAPFAEGRENIFQNKVLTQIAQAHNKSVAQVILRWLVQRNVVALSKSTHKNRMEENIDVFDFQLTEAEMERIKLLDHARPLILNNRDLEVVERINPRLAQKQFEQRMAKEK